MFNDKITWYYNVQDWKTINLDVNVAYNNFNWGKAKDNEAVKEFWERYRE